MAAGLTGGQELVKIVFGADISGLQKASVLSGQEFQKLGRTIQKTGVIIAATFGIIAAAASKAFAEVEFSAAQIASLMDDISTNTVPQLSREVVDMSVKFGQSFQTMAKARYDIVSGGFRDIADSAMVLNAASTLALAGAAEVGPTAKLVVQALRGYGLAAEEATAISDKLFQTVKFGITTVPELSSALGRIFSTARAAGVGINELLSAVSVLTAITGNTNESVNALNRLLFAMSAPTSQAAEAMKEHGIEVLDNTGRVMDLIDVIKQFSGLTLGQIKVLIGGRINAARAMIIMAQNTDTYKEALFEMSRAQGSASNAAELMADTTKKSWDRMIQTFNDLRFTIGEVISKDVRLWFEGIKKMIIGVKDFVENNNTLIASLIRVGIQFGGLLIISGTLLRILGALARFIGITFVGGAILAMLKNIPLVTGAIALMRTRILSSTVALKGFSSGVAASVSPVRSLSIGLVALSAGLMAVEDAARQQEDFWERFQTIAVSPLFQTMFGRMLSLGGMQQQQEIANTVKILKEAIEFFATPDEQVKLKQWGNFVRETTQQVLNTKVRVEEYADAWKTGGVVSMASVKRTMFSLLDLKETMLLVETILQRTGDEGGAAAAIGQTFEGILRTSRNVNESLRESLRVMVQMTREAGRMQIMDIPFKGMLGLITRHHPEFPISPILAPSGAVPAGPAGPMTPANLDDAIRVIFADATGSVVKDAKTISNSWEVVFEEGSGMFQDLAMTAARARKDTLAAWFDLMSNILRMIHAVQIASQMGAITGLIGPVGAVLGSLGIVLSGSGRRGQTGGLVTGTGIGHTVHALLQPGEFVLSKASVEAIQQRGTGSTFNLTIAPNVTLQDGTDAEVRRVADQISTLTKEQFFRTYRELRIAGRIS